MLFPLSHPTSSVRTKESVSVICHDSGFGDRVIVGDEGVEKYKEQIRVARKILAEVNQTLQGRVRGSTWFNIPIDKMNYQRAFDGVSFVKC